MKAKTEAPAGFTPLMRQFNAIKNDHPDKILFFRMGDFYEMFGDDAVKAAPILGIALTSRSHGKGERIPLAGMPYHAVDRYLARLLSSGHKVVIVEQVEDPKTAKGLVKREVVEILTPGTAVIDSESDTIGPARLAAIYPGSNGTLGLAILDVGTGAFLVDQGPAEEIIEKLKVAEPAELLYPQQAESEPKLKYLKSFDQDGRLTAYEDWNFDFATAERDLTRHFETSTLDGFGVAQEKAAIIAAGAVFRYLKDNHRDHLGHITRLTRIDSEEHMLLDYSSVRNLELVRNVSDGSEVNTLLGVMDRCQTGAGKRRLRQSLLRPFKTKEKIERRLGGVAELVKNRNLCMAIGDETKQLPDMERLAGRLGLGKLNPRQAAAIGKAWQVAGRLRLLLEQAASPLLASLAQAMPDGTEVIERLEQALVAEPPLVVNRGGIFRPGFSERLDEMNNSIRAARQYISGLQKTERERTGIPSLKVGFNKIFGYYLEVTKTHSETVPEHYQRKQTLVNAERYITPELKEKEELIFAAEDKIFSLETELFAELVVELNLHISDIILTAELLAELDLVSALAELAVARNYCRPEICGDRRLFLENGRHPVVEAVLPSGSFVANDVDVAPDRQDIIILTGPNMSGKSTYLRQVGLITIMAQIGSFVPADKAEIGLVDRVFTRVGALDNLAGGQSTFLVEMVETANILNNATERSLVLLDEVGRGTSTFDGLSVAWSVVERIHDDCRCRTIFATHYHELTGMAELYGRIGNYQVAVKKWQEKVIFLHKIIAGGCDDSYGIEVARLAGLPTATIKRARKILRLLESGKFTQSELGRSVYKEKVQTSFFEAPPSEVERLVREVDLENMSPVEAFDLLRQLKDKLS